MRRLTSCVAVLVALVLGACGGSAGRATITRSERVTLTSTVSAAPVAREVTNAFPQPSWRRFLGPVPILVYHDLGNAPASEPYPGLYMSYADFRQEMAWLHSQGYQAVTLDEVMSAWYHHGTLPAKPVVITFDNGYPPQVTEAPRVMSRYGWPGVLNEITEGHLHNSQLQSVLKLGWEVDSHSLTHPDMTTLDATDLRAQLVDSRRFLQDAFHIPADSFCYPSSKYNSAVIAAVRAAGYTNATTEGHAYATRADPYLLPRFEMETGLPELQADLETPH